MTSTLLSAVQPSPGDQLNMDHIQSTEADERLTLTKCVTQVLSPASTY